MRVEKDFVSGKRVVVMGLGRFGGGLDAALFAQRAGANVLVTDTADESKLGDALGELRGLAGIEYRLCRHEKSDFEQADIVIVNPAVAPENEYVRMAKDSGAHVTTQMNMFFERCPAVIVGITGSNGKSTTTALTAHLLEAGIGQVGTSYRKVWLGGNIGNRPLLQMLDDITGDDVVVLELSSFQLEWFDQIQKAPQVSLLTNLTPNHLDRHITFENYCAAKERIFKFQNNVTLNNERSYCGDLNCSKVEDCRVSLRSARNDIVSIFNAEDPIALGWHEEYKNDDSRRSVLYRPEDVSGEIAGAFGLPGRFNLSNLAGAMAIAKVFNVNDERIIASLPKFKSLSHRLELVAERKGVRYYNDSISTTPESSIAALGAFAEGKVIIAGGYDKGMPFDEFGAEIAKKAKAAVLIGTTAGKIAECIKRASANGGVEVLFAKTLEEAVGLSAKAAAAGDVVLLSPACASYDMFVNFQHRGKEFARIVCELPG